MNLHKPETMSQFINWVALALLGLVTVAGYLTVAWDAFAPLFHLPTANMGEAIGFVLLLALPVALVALLKESKP